MKLCGKPAHYVHGAEPCPREDGHAGPHYWWIPFEVGSWRVIVYEGEAAERRRVCRGAFVSRPSSQDVYQLLVTLSERRRREKGEHAPMPKHEGTCRSCNAPIYWTTTAKGKKMPVDVKPDEEGKLVLYMNDSGIQARHENDAPDFALRRVEGRRYISHFVTCPNRAHHRKG